MNNHPHVFPRERGPIRRVALISPPCIRPTAPPLGPPVLSAFLKKHLPDIQVRCFDLNLDYYYLAMEFIKTGMCKLCLYEWDYEKTVERVETAISFLKEVSPSRSNLDEYHRYSTWFLSFENIFNSFMSEMATRYLAGIRIPDSIEAFFESLLEQLLDYCPDFWGISMLFDNQMPCGLLIAKMMREKTGPRVVLGGARFGVLVEPGRILAKPIQLERNRQKYQVVVRNFVDAIVSGEGEMALLHMLQAKEEGEFFHSPDLIWWQDGRLHRNGPQVIHTLDLLPPPDFSGFRLKRYIAPRIILPFMTARGCPWGKCAFCTHHHTYRRYRQMSIERAVDVLGRLNDTYGVSYFNLFDEMIPPARFRNLARHIIASGLSIRYAAYGKPVRAFDRQTMRIIFESGCRLILWGIESASQRILDLMNKGTRVEDMRNVLHDAAASGISNLLFIMFGFPGETMEEFEQTLAFLEENASVIAALSKGRFRLVDGSPIMNRPSRFGIYAINKVPSDPMAEPDYTYKLNDGLGPSEIKKMYTRYLPRLESLGASPRFGTYREHLLIYASQWG